MVASESGARSGYWLVHAAGASQHVAPDLHELWAGDVQIYAGEIVTGSPAVIRNPMACSFDWTVHHSYVCLVAGHDDHCYTQANMCIDMVLHHVAQVSDASERQIAHMRAQAATSSGQHVEALRKAQDICSQSESKTDAADRYKTCLTTCAPMLPGSMPEHKICLHV